MAEKPVEGPESTPDLERLDAGWERAGMSPRERARAKAAEKKARRDERARTAASKQKQKQKSERPPRPPKAAMDRDGDEDVATDDEVSDAPAIAKRRRARPFATKQLAYLVVAIAVIAGVAFALTR